MTIETLWGTPFQRLNVEKIVDCKRIEKELQGYKTPIGDDDIFAYLKDSYAEQVRDSIIVPFIESFIMDSTGIQIPRQQMAVRSWVVLNSFTMIEKLHEHKHSHFSSVFYPVATGGPITFLDPRNSAIRGYPTSFREKLSQSLTVSPRTGDVIIFPSFLEHHSDGSGTGKRICMPTDVRILS